MKARVIGVALLLTATSASAQRKRPPPPAGPKVEYSIDVETAEQLYAKLDYDHANEVAIGVTKQRGLTHDQLVRTYRVLAVTAAILDKEEAARDAFLALLTFDPDYAVDQALGPKVNTPFVEARGQYRLLSSKPGVEVVANIRDDGGQLRVTTHDPTHVAKKVIVGYRWTSNEDYTIAQVGPNEASVEVVAAPKGRTRLDFYAQASDDRDDAIFEAGDPQAPKSAFAEVTTKAGTGAPAKEKSVFASPLLWLVAGAALAGGGTALFFILRPHDPPTQASLSPQIRCGDELCK